MNAKEYLLQGKHYASVIENTLREIQHYKDMAKVLSFVNDGIKVQTSGKGDRVADGVVKYVDLERELHETIIDAQRKQREVVDTIRKLPPAQYDVLHRIYVQGMLLKHIETDMKRSHTWVCNTHRKALENLQIILDQRTAELI